MIFADGTKLYHHFVPSDFHIALQRENQDAQTVTDGVVDGGHSLPLRFFYYYRSRDILKHLVETRIFPLLKYVRFIIILTRSVSKYSRECCMAAFGSSMVSYHTVTL